MATSYKEAELQGGTAVTVYGNLYNTAGAVTAVISNLVVCNTGTVAATYRIGIMDTNGTPTAANWRAYDVPITANETILVGSFCMQANRYIQVSSSGTVVTFAAEIAEIS